MCGIAGILCAEMSQENLAVTAEAMVSTLVHRGPDDSGIWLDAPSGMALGHRRLSIIDLSAAGHQPMISESGRFVISYNGEVYNHRELAQELEAGGRIFRGHSDTEVILASIETYGLVGAVERFVGMFAFALWDREQNELLLVRDRLGIKPLYWGRFGKLFLFGSELKALRACTEWKPEVGRDAVAAFMRWNYVPAPQTIYRGISKLEPGHLLKVAPGKAPRIEKYWDPLAVAQSGIEGRLHMTDDDIMTSPSS